MSTERNPQALMAPKVAALTILIVGLGGVGSIVARYLCTYLASLALRVKLVLCDGDRYQPSDAKRQLFARSGPKAEVVRDELLTFFASSSLTILADAEYITAANVAQKIREHSLCALCLDNSASRKLINDHARTLRDCCLVSGGNDGVELTPDGRQLRGTYGNCHVYCRQGGEERTRDLTYLHREVAEPADRHPQDVSCTQALVSTPQILWANLMTASVICNTIWLYLCGALHYSEIAFDIADGLMQPVVRLPAPIGPDGGAGASAPDQPR